MNISVVLPAYNEEISIASVITEVHNVLTQLGHTFEIIVVDDASTDSTSIQAANTSAKVISHKYNKGYGRSIKDGIREAWHEYVLIIDADGQHSPHDIPKLLAYAEEYDMVIGARKNAQLRSWRLPGKWFLGKLCNYLAQTYIPDINSGLRVFKKAVMEQYVHLCSNEFSFTMSSTLAFLADERDMKYVPIDVVERKHGTSRVTIGTGFQTILLAIQIIMVFYPLRFFLPLALFISVYGTVFSIYGIIRYYSFPRTGILTVLAGIIFFCFGLVADQIARLRRELQSK